MTLTTDSHINKCRIIAVVRDKDGGLHNRMRACKGSSDIVRGKREDLSKAVTHQDLKKKGARREGFHQTEVKYAQRLYGQRECIS